MPYDHELYLANCRMMIGKNEFQVEKTKAAIKKTRNPARIADLKLELEGWIRWVDIWKQRLSDAERIRRN